MVDNVDLLSFQQLVDRFGDAVAEWEAVKASFPDWEAFNAWARGTANEGPNSDGWYPLPTVDGSIMVPSPLRLAAMSSGGQTVQITEIVFADNQMVRAANSAASHRPIGKRRVLLASACVKGRDLSPVEAEGIRIDIKVGGSSVLSSPLRILPGKLSSRDPGTPQPVFAQTLVQDDQEITWDVQAAGFKALGLRVSLLTMVEA